MSNLNLEEFGLCLKSDWLTTTHRCYRPPSWPPPRDWVVSEKEDGEVLSRWGDPIWDLSPWAGKAFVLNFGDGETTLKCESIDSANADLLRLLTTWRMWGPRAAGAANTLKNCFVTMRQIIVLCSQQGILASELNRFPQVLAKVPTVISPSGYEKAIGMLHRFWDARDQIGFFIVDAESIKRLANSSPDHDPLQSAYIPPRIWTYQVLRLRECLDDFNAHKNQIVRCFNFCIDAYAENHGSLRGALTASTRQMASRRPFQEPQGKNQVTRFGIHCHGRFADTAKRFGLDELLARWLTIPLGGLDVRQLCAYLSLIQYAGLAYIVNFTLQRISEGASLRADCLKWEKDEKLGRIPIICGETTKTEVDCDARWPTSPSVEVAVLAMTTVAQLRMRCAAANPLVQPSVSDQANPFLFDRAFEPWSGSVAQRYQLRPPTISYSQFCRRNPILFDVQQLRITDEDLQVAVKLNPTLAQREEFAVGKVWPLSWHQLRRTGAVNMFASGLLSDSSMQVLMKHSSRLMPLYYGRGYTNLHLNEEVEGIVISAMYEAISHSLKSAIGDRFVSPHGDERKQAIVVNLVSDKDSKDLAAAARRGETSFREIRLGACTKRGPCSYGGIESVARCAGGDGGRPCADVLYDRTKSTLATRDRARILRDLASVPDGSPRQIALRAELNGLENFLNDVQI